MNLRTIFILIFALGAILRFADVMRPIDRASWRECDEGAIARNYVREGMNPLLPRIDWRGTTPGYAEMEFPVYPYLTAVFYKVLGVDDYLPRLINFLFSLLTLFLFLALARSLLGEPAAAFAFAFFAFHPLTVELSTSVQPEGIMFTAYLAAVYFFTRWIRTGKTRDFLPAAASSALMILAKAPAAHVGLLFAFLLFQKFGASALKETRVWIFGLIALLPAAAWYIYAKSLWTTYGNSLGLSNEYHWVGPDFFTNPYFVRGIFTIEATHVWLVFGLFAAAFAVWKGFREKPVQICLIWFVSIFAFYIAAARTTADEWAYYYHIFSVAPAALLFGFSVAKTFDRETGKIFRFLLILFAAALFLYEAKQNRTLILQHRTADVSFACVPALKPALQKEGLILASGGNCADADGYPTAYNSSYMFYWLDRKGFNICREQQSIEKVREFAQNGAVYFVAEKQALAEKPNFEAELRQTFKVAAECDTMILFELQ
jgi:uncharacterized membrane protein